MSQTGFELGLADPAGSGIYFVAAGDLAPLAAAAGDAGLLARHVDLSGCTSKATLLLRLAMALEAPGGRGRNWDGLGDNLRDLDWLPAAGYALLLEGAADFRAGQPQDFERLLAVLEQACADWTGRNVPFWVFIALPEAMLEAMDSGA